MLAAASQCIAAAPAEEAAAGRLVALQADSPVEPRSGITTEADLFCASRLDVYRAAKY